MKATIKQLLDYCATQEEAVIAYKASKMILAVHSDNGYCNKKNSQSQAGGHFPLSNNNEHPPTTEQFLPSNDHKRGHVISCGGRIRSTISQRMQGGIFTTNTHWDGPPTTTNFIPNWQFDGQGSNQQQNPAQTNQGNGHVLPLAMWPRSTRSIPYLLVARKDQPRRLFTKHPPPLHHVNVRSESLTKDKDLAEARRQWMEQGQTNSKLTKSWIATRVC